MNFVQNLINNQTTNFYYLQVSMDDHQAHYSHIKHDADTKLSQLDILNQFHLLLNSKQIALKQVRIKRNLFLVAYDISKSKAKIFTNTNGKYYIHRELIFCRKDSTTGLLTSLSLADAKLIASVAGNISDSYNYGFWTIQFDNIIDVNSGKNVLN